MDHPSPGLTRLALHNYLTKTSQDFGARAHRLQMILDQPRVRLTKDNQILILKSQIENTKQMISVLNTFSLHLEALESSEWQGPPFR